MPPTHTKPPYLSRGIVGSAVVIVFGLFMCIGFDLMSFSAVEPDPVNGVTFIVFGLLALWGRNSATKSIRWLPKLLINTDHLQRRNLLAGALCLALLFAVGCASGEDASRGTWADANQASYAPIHIGPHGGPSGGGLKPAAAPDADTGRNTALFSEIITQRENELTALLDQLSALPPDDPTRAELLKAAEAKRAELGALRTASATGATFVVGHITVNQTITNSGTGQTDSTGATTQTPTVETTPEVDANVNLPGGAGDLNVGAGGAGSGAASGTNE